MFEYFSKSVEKIEVSLNEDQNTFLIISRRILFRMRNVLDRVLEKIKTHFMFLQVPPHPRKSWHLWDDLEKFGTAGQATVDIMAQARCRLDTWGYTHTHTHRICNIYCFSTGTMVAWMRRNFKLYVQFLVYLWSLIMNFWAETCSLWLTILLYNKYSCVWRPSY
jgi:hypothetical protein